MGAVYLARDQRLDSEVALKETLFTDERLSRAFEREARLLARLRHPALPRVSDHFIEEHGQFLIMEYIPGEDLAQIMKRSAVPFPYDDVIRWADQLLDALEYLHSQEPPVVHRDIKPQNLKLNERGQIILLDFGLAKNSPLQMTRVTSSGSIYGFTPNYAPMEQIQGVGTDTRSDLYSLGATLYHFVTGATPQDALTRAAAVVDGQPDPLRAASELNGQVSSAVAGVIQKALALSRNQRHVSATEMRGALCAACDAASNVAFQDTAVIGALRRERPVKEREGDAPTLPALAHVETQKRGLSAIPPSHDVPMLAAAEVEVQKTESESADEETALRVEVIPSVRVQELISAGASAFDAREYALALGHWEAAMKLSPAEPGIKESVDGARRLIRKEDGRKARVERLVAEGTEAFDAKRYELAIERWSEALALSPDEPGVEASVKAARVAAEKQRQREAKVKHLVLGGAEAFDVEDYELAIQQWTEVLTLSPDEPGIKQSIEAAGEKQREILNAANKESRSHQNEVGANPIVGFEMGSVRRSSSRPGWPTYLLNASPRTPFIVGAGVLIFILLLVLVLLREMSLQATESESQSTAAAQNVATKQQVAPAPTGNAAIRAEEPLALLAPGQALIVKVEAATGDSWVRYQIDDLVPTTLILKQGQSQILPPAQNQVALNYGSRLTLKFKINNRDANFPPDAPKFKSKVVISRDNLRTFFQ